MKNLKRFSLLKAIIAATILLSLPSCSKPSNKSVPANECKTCQAFYASGYAAGPSRVVCDGTAEEKFREEYSYAAKIECNK